MPTNRTTNCFAILIGASLLCAATLLFPPNSKAISSDDDKPAYIKHSYRPKARPTQQPTRKRKYVHPCPAGTEQFGEAPPDGARVYCRQPTLKGYRKHGTFKSWYQNGTLRAEGDYHLDEKHGVWKIYHRNGQLKFKEEWYNGKRVKKEKMDRNGHPIEQVDRRAERLKRREEDAWRYESSRTSRVKARTSGPSWLSSGPRSRRKNILKGRNRKGILRRRNRKITH